MIWLPPALTSSPIWFREEGDGGSTEALDDGVLLPKSAFPPSLLLFSHRHALYYLVVDVVFFPTERYGTALRADRRV